MKHSVLTHVTVVGENIWTPRKTDSNSSVSSNSVISFIRQCEKENIQFQGQKENKTQHENL